MPRDPRDGGRASRPYSEILQLNQELVRNLESAAAEDEGRKKELGELRFAHDQAVAEITRLREELRHANERDAQRHEQLRQLEQERVDQLTAMSAHLDALRAAVDRYLQQGRSKAA
jgi:predicted nuclease with TOPRIM domain